MMVEKAARPLTLGGEMKYKEGNTMLEKMFRMFLPDSARMAIDNMKILFLHHGQYETFKRKISTDRAGEPVPWFTYPAIEFLAQLDLGEKTVFEYGGGASTLYFSKRCRKLYSVDDDLAWHEMAKKTSFGGGRCKYAADKQEYVSFIHEVDGSIDLIVIDGKYRYECAAEAVKKLAPDGMIILDNSDWHEKTAKYLRNNDLIEIDMAGFGPVNAFAWTTSFFMTRKIELKTISGRQPAYAVGGFHYDEEV